MEVGVKVHFTVSKRILGTLTKRVKVVGFWRYSYSGLLGLGWLVLVVGLVVVGVGVGVGVGAGSGFLGEAFLVFLDALALSR